MAKVRAKPGSGLAGYTPQRTLAQPNRNAENQARESAAAKVAQARPTTSALGSGNGTALPWDSIAEGQVATAGANYKNSVAQVAANRAIGEQEFGIDVGYDDYRNNPYSQAAILQHNHESNARGINTTAGQALYSGQTANAQAIEQGRTNQAHQELVNADERAKANWLAEERAAEIADQEAINAAKEGAIQRALEATPPEVPPEVPLNEGSGGGSQQKEKIPYPAPPKKKWAWNGSHWHLVKA